MNLDHEFCLKRQTRLRQALTDKQCDAALITDRNHVYYFTNHWSRVITSQALYVPVSGSTVLSSSYASDDLFVDDVRVFTSDDYATLRDDQAGLALNGLQDELRSTQRLGCDAALRPFPGDDNGRADIVPALLNMRRCKDADEVAVIRHAIHGADAAYTEARRILEPGITEIDVHAAMHAAAIRAVGEAIGEFGNDFRAGAGGGAPRVRAVEAGELMPLDIGVVVRGHNSDLCRTLSVDGNPTDAQHEAHALVAAELDYVEKTVKPGVSCLQLFNDVQGRLDGTKGWSFQHHLGHGIGLHPHEAPRLNPHYDDTFQPGDVFTAEPGLYGDDLRAGIRLEHNYLVTETGLERLSHHPLDL